MDLLIQSKLQLRYPLLILTMDSERGGQKRIRHGPNSKITKVKLRQISF